jgi:hypothetical protein
MQAKSGHMTIVLGASDGHDQNDHVIVFKQTSDRLAETMNVTFC